MPASAPHLDEILKALEKRYGRLSPGQPTDPLGVIQWEMIGYLCEDVKRAEAFKALEKYVGLKPKAILATPLPALEEICRIGGIHPALRAKRLHEISQLVIDEFQGDLRNALKLPLKQAMKAMRKFPSIGEPGAEKILLFSGTHPFMALDSNGLRVLARVVFGQESKSYSTTYRMVREAFAGKFTPDCAMLTRAYVTLRRHGQELCRRTMPQCGDCPLVKICAHAKELTKLRPKPV